jgi:2-polyprenyl-6-methoxyphenol hydroxylase-like FAD-dependent oxidoreductase
VVVGGGPAGMATALMLAQHGWTDITVIESHDTVQYIDPQRCAGGRHASVLLGCWMGCWAAGLLGCWADSCPL